MKRKYKKLTKKLIYEGISVEKVEQIFNSWCGHAKHGDTYNLICSIFLDGLLYWQNRKGAIKVQPLILDLERSKVMIRELSVEKGKEVRNCTV